MFQGIISLAGVNDHDIKSGFSIHFVHPEICISCSDQAFLLFQRDKLVRPGRVILLPGLDLNKYEFIAVPGNQIYFKVLETPVSFQQNKSFLLQIFGCQFFSKGPFLIRAILIHLKTLKSRSAISEKSHE